MMTIFQLSPSFAVTGASTVGDFATASNMGFRSVINFRPDGEVHGQLTNDAAAESAEAAGLKYFYIPAHKYELFTDAIVSRTARAIASAPFPILAFCASGQRAAVIWAATTARTEPVDGVLAALRDAGFDLAFLRDDLESQANRASWSTDSPTAAENTLEFAGSAAA